MKKAITPQKAQELIKELNLIYGDSFSNNSPSDLCWEYRMETGYWLPYGNQRLVHLVTTKDEQDEAKYINKAYLELTYDTFGLYDEADSDQSSLDRASKALAQVSAILGETYDLTSLIKKPNSFG